MSQTVFYKKNKDGEFEEVSVYDDDLIDAYPVGTSVLVSVDKNCTSRKYKVDPDYIALSAAAQHLSSRLSSILLDELSGRAERNDNAQLTPHQQDLINQLKSSGIGRYWFPSYAEVAEKILQVLIDAAKPATQVPWVKETAEQYRAAMILAMNENNEH